MTKEELKALGLDDAAADKVAASSATELKNYVVKTKFDEISESKKNLESQLSDRDKQLETLKKSSGDTEELKKQIEALQTANKTAKNEYEGKLKDLQFTNAIKLAVADKAQDVDLVAGLFDKSKMLLGDDGKITGLDEQVKELQKNKAFLFKTAANPAYNPAGGAGNQSKNPFADKTFNLTEQGKLLRENPEQAKILAAEAGKTL
ncbi:phage scaffolding protein [Pectinatus frisingensis]|uniref:phage scaffolding protein n=1 Tax=Pectinatus frisingensis TaxID=865 RepID=UPI0015F35EB7|nr:phage scaffolding protein [Pectinatus frisingensis]